MKIQIEAHIQTTEREIVELELPFYIKIIKNPDPFHDGLEITRVNEDLSATTISYRIIGSEETGFRKWYIITFESEYSLTYSDFTRDACLGLGEYKSSEEEFRELCENVMNQISSMKNWE